MPPKKRSRDTESENSSDPGNATKPGKKQVAKVRAPSAAKPVKISAKLRKSLAQWSDTWRPRHPTTSSHLPESSSKNHKAAAPASGDGRRVGESDLVGIPLKEAQLLVTFLSHYPHIVFVGFSWWRKIMTMIVDSHDTLIPPREFKKFFPRAENKIHTSVELGLMGALGTFTIQQVFTPQKRKSPFLTLASKRAFTTANAVKTGRTSACTAGGGGAASAAKEKNFIQFMGHAIINDQRDVVVTALLGSLGVDLNQSLQAVIDLADEMSPFLLAAFFGRTALVDLILQYRPDLFVVYDDSDDDNGDADAVPGSSIEEEEDDLAVGPVTVTSSEEDEDEEAPTDDDSDSDDSDRSAESGYGGGDDGTIYTLVDKALWWAHERKHTETAELLLKKHGANIKIISEHGFLTTLRWGSPEMLQLLIQYGPDRSHLWNPQRDPNKKQENENWTVLHNMSSGGENERAVDIQKLDVLFRYGNADVNAKSDINGETPLCLAVEYGGVETLKMLLRNGADLNLANDYESPLSQAVSKYSPLVVQLLLEEGKRREASGRTGINLEYETEYRPTALHGAVFRQDLEMVKLLLRHGANTDASFGPDLTLPLHTAVRKNEVEMVRAILEHDAAAGKKKNPGAGIEGQTIAPLHVVRSPEVATLLLEHGADVTAVDKEVARMPLHHLCAVSSSGVKPSQWRSEQEERQKTALVLIKKGKADIDAQEPDAGYTPLAVAVEFGNKEMVQFLLLHGADMLAVEKTTKQNSLHLAAGRNDLDVLKVMWKQAPTQCVAAAKVQDEKRRTPLEVAERRTETEEGEKLANAHKIVALLKKIAKK